jgi:hypothetical protein
MILRRRWASQPQVATPPAGAFVPAYFWTPHGGQTLIGPKKVQANNYGGSKEATSGGIAIDNATKTLDENFAISEASAFPFVLAGSFICRATTANEAAVGIGQSTGGAGTLYGFVGQYASGFIGGAASTDTGGNDGAINGPAAVVGQQYNAIYISRSIIDHTLWVNGVKYVSTANKAGATNTWGNFTIGACNRGSTRVFRGTQDVLQGFFHIGDVPGDGWAREWSINPNMIFAPLPRKIWIGVSAAGSHAATGDLLAGDSSIAGTALHPHTSTGVLAAQDATVAGTALHPHTATGTLAAQAATIVGTALHPHTSTGALAAQAATVAGTALHPHTATGVLASQAATVAGTATHLTLHTATGALASAAASVAGVAVHGKDATGTLEAQASTVAGTAAHLTLHTSTGTLAAQASTVAGTALHPHTATGAIAAGAAVIAGTAAHLTLHTATGALAAGAATVSGDAVLASTTHEATGNLSAQAAAVVGAAIRISTSVPTGGGGFRPQPKPLVFVVDDEELMLLIPVFLHVIDAR